MRDAHSVAKVRAAEAELMARLPEGALMQRAAAGLAAVCARLLDGVYGTRVLLLVGGGDNGGDALYAGARLARRGARVTAALASTRAHEEGLAALREAGGRILPRARLEELAAGGRGAGSGGSGSEGGSDGGAGGSSSAGADGSEGGGGSDSADGSGSRDGSGGGIDAGGSGGAGGLGSVFADADLVVDGLTGIGGKGALRGVYAALVSAVPEEVAVVACDVPSGVDADTGEVGGEAVRADVTVTFGTLKPGLLVDPGAAHAGVVELVDIGLDLPEPDVVAATGVDVRLPEPGPESDKYSRGVVGILAGGPEYTGAAVLAVGSALHGGAGMVRFASAEPVVDLVRQRWPEAVTTVLSGDASDPSGGAPDPSRDVLDLAGVGRVQAWVVGPGLGTDARARRLVQAALETDVPVLVDADGLNVLAGLPEARRRALLDRPAPTVLTPHAGELSRLLGADRAAIEARRLAHVRRAAAELNATVLLKGSTTLVASPGEHAVRANLTGTPRLATAGTGDVLSGLIGALLASGLPAPRAAAYGAHLHGLAARLAAAPDPSQPASPITAHDVLTSLPAAFRGLF